jgi:FixJ family two-component response regulator
MHATPKLVIVVDDDAAVRSSLKFALELEGFVVRAYDGGAAMLADREWLSGGCLVVDEFMPGMTGVELVRHLRRRSVAMPAILITAKPSATLSRRAALSGIEIVLEKPLEDGALLGCIREALRARDPAV